LKRKKLVELQWGTPLVDTSSEQEKMLLNKEAFAAMFKALDELTDTSREMILLRFQQELSITEIAEIFEVSEGAVKMKISRALQKMKTFLVGGDQLEKTISKSIAA
jgi:RNA polymerase sigma-70 factor (ECF subfamily)